MTNIKNEHSKKLNEQKEIVSRLKEVNKDAKY